MAHTKTFDGLRYQYYDSGFMKLKAKQKANELRRKGYSVRMVETSLGWALYRRHKIS